MPPWRHAALRGAPHGGWHAEWTRRLARLYTRLARVSARGQVADYSPPGCAGAATGVLAPPLLAY